MKSINWRTPKRSNQGNCVQVALLPSTVLVQDSKNPGPRLTVSTADWSALVTAIRSGRLN
jgi:hypothetical protein